MSRRSEKLYPLGITEDELCHQCLDAVGSLALVFGLWREARFVRLSVTHKWHLVADRAAWPKETMCKRAWRA